ncbi:hypothetical protein RS030_71082 [Cryptosporidium xiaoi]|uniref:AP2/ERF domain-containing protein n=1 Tax=Cryptosporidium xiaoi TaxID=659607 RepID=A0AAV9XTJ8_9CRYT
MDDECGYSREYIKYRKLGYDYSIDSKGSSEDIGIDNNIENGGEINNNIYLGDDKENISCNILLKKQNIKYVAINNDEMNYISNNYCGNSLFKEGDINKLEIKDMNPYYILQVEKIDPPQIENTRLSDNGHISDDKEQSYHGICISKNSDGDVEIINDSSVIDKLECKGSLNDVIATHNVSSKNSCDSLPSETVTASSGVFGFEYQHDCDINVDNRSETNNGDNNNINNEICINLINDHEYEGSYNQNVDYDNNDNRNIIDLIKVNNEENMIDSVLETRIRTAPYYHTQMRSSGLDKFTVVDVNGKRSISQEVENQAQLMPSIPGIYFDKKQIGYRVRYHNSYIGWVALSRYSSIKDAYEYAKKLWLDARNRSKEGNYVDEDDNIIIERERRSGSMLNSGKRNRRTSICEDKPLRQDVNVNQQDNLYTCENEIYKRINNMNTVEEFAGSHNLQLELLKDESDDIVGTNNEMCFFQCSSTGDMLNDIMNPQKIRQIQNDTSSNSCFDLKLFKEENGNINNKRKNNRYSALETMKKLYMATYDYMEKWPSKDGNYTIYWSDTSNLSLFLYGENCEFTQKKQKPVTRRNRVSNIFGCNNGSGNGKINNYIWK